jgi:hypothetical protein
MQVQPKYSGAFGKTELGLTPQAARALTLDVKNCPHCGVHHASLSVEVLGNGRFLARCPALGGARLEVILKLFLHVP